MRVDNWPRALAELVASAEGRAFQWGSHDCGTFAAAAERALTGACRFDDALGNYRTARGAARKLGRLGFGSIEELVEDRLIEIGPNWAQRGDVVIVDTELGPALGVVTGETAVSPAPEGGLARYPVAAARRAFRVD